MSGSGARDETLQALELENADLRERLAEAEGVLQAIRRGEVDAVIVSGPDGERVFTLEGADHPYRVMVESMNEGAATLSADGSIVYANGKLADLLGTTREQLIGTRLHSWAAPEDQARLDRLFQTSGDGPSAGELTMVASNRATLPVLASFSALRLSAEAFCCAIITDFTLAKHHEALERAAREVRAANERLREADQRKDEFLATLGHELRNPLAPIRAAAEVIRLIGPADDRLARAREIIERQVAHMARLVDDLLEVSRITAGRIELRCRTENLRAIVQSVAEAARSSLKPHQKLTVEVSGEPLPVHADEIRLSQAISNVLENAVKYSPDDAHIVLRASRDANEAVVRVTDNGIGIPREMLSRIFDMFVQADCEGHRGQGGLGIGLALTRRLIEMHGGEIEAWSPGPGEGSEFTIRLPLARGPEAQAGVHDHEHHCQGAQRRVLIVDDNVDAADSLSELLQLSGHQVKAVYDGPAALETVPAFQPDVVLLDIGLPGMDGYEVARRLRARFGPDYPTLVALSGWGQAEDKRRATDAGMDAYFTKPMNPAALEELFAEHAPQT